MTHQVAATLARVCEEMRCIARGIEDPKFRPYAELLAERDRLIARIVEISEGDSREIDKRASLASEINAIGEQLHQLSIRRRDAGWQMRPSAAKEARLQIDQLIAGLQRRRTELIRILKTTSLRELDSHATIGATE